MRLKDIVKGGGVRPTPSREVKETSQRLSDLVRGAVNPVSPEGPPLKDRETADQVFQGAVTVVEEIFRAARAQLPFSLTPAERVVETLRQHLVAGDALLVSFFRGDDPSPSLARETVNVCIIALKIGLELGYTPEELRRLGLAALLCNIGMALVPAWILEKKGALAPDERALLEHGLREGATLLKKLGPKDTWLATAVEKRYQGGPHHPEQTLEEYAAIIHLVDIYESLVHHRPFRRRLGPLEALKEILQRERSAFPDRILKALIRALSTFPVGSLVRLNTGEIGRVMAKNKNYPLRPVVEILARRDKRLEEPVIIDLSQNLLLYIQDSVIEEALPL